MKFVPKELRETRDVSRGSWRFKDHFGSIAIVIGLLVGAYFGIGFAADQIARRISEKTEMDWFGGIAAAMKGKAPGARESKIFKKLVAEANLRPLSYRLTVIESDEMNAFAVPGGTVAITTSLLTWVKSEQGLSMVLGHELGHQQHRHALRRLGRSLAIKGLIALIFGSDSSGLVKTASNMATFAHSRDQEREADAFGLHLVHRVYGDTTEATEFFERALAEERKRHPSIPALFSSHPLTTERIATLRKLAPDPG